MNGESNTQKIPHSFTGNTFEIENREDIAYIVDNIRKPAFKKDGISLFKMGTWFTLSFYDDTGKVVDEFIVNADDIISKVIEENFASLPQEWDRALENGTLQELYALNNSQPAGLLGVSVHNSIEWKYFIAVSSTLNTVKFEEYHIPAATWAVFSGRGTNRSLQDLIRRVVTEWLPTSGYEYAEIPDVEVYIKADPKDAIYEYWLPVIKRKEKNTQNGNINHENGLSM